jgi:hypothetical protein
MTNKPNKEDIIAELNKEYDLLLQSEQLSEGAKAVILEQLFAMAIVEKVGNDQQSEKNS